MQLPTRGCLLVPVPVPVPVPPSSALMIPLSSSSSSLNGSLLASLSCLSHLCSRTQAAARPSLRPLTSQQRGRMLLAPPLPITQSAQVPEGTDRHSTPTTTTATAFAIPLRLPPHQTSLVRPGSQLISPLRSCEKQDPTRSPLPRRERRRCREQQTFFS